MTHRSYLFRVFALCAAVLASPARADMTPNRVSMLIGSHHVGGLGFEERNPGVFVTWERSPLDFTVGAYRNSYGRGSVAATVAVPIWSRASAEISLFGGAAYYPKDGRRFAMHAGDLVPIGGLQIRYRNLFLQAIPGNGKHVDAVIGVGMTWALTDAK